MARWFALPLVALVVAAVVVRLAAPRPAEAPVAAPPEAAPAPLLVFELEAPPPEPEPESPGSISVQPTLADELKRLAEGRFPDESILAYARATGRPFRPTADEVIALKDAGMSDVLIGRLTGAPPPAEPAPRTVEPTVVVQPSPVYVYPSTTVYVPVEVTVVETPPEPAVQTVVLCAPHAPPHLQRPAIYQEPPFFKTHAFMPTKRLPTAEEVALREAARRRR